MMIFPKRWHNGHSLAAGTLAGLAAASYRPWLIFAAGLGCGLMLAGGIRLARLLAEAFRTWQLQARAKAESLGRGRTASWEDAAVAYRARVNARPYDRVADEVPF